MHGGIADVVMASMGLCHSIFFPMASVGQPMETLGPCPFFFESIYNSKCKMTVKSKVKFKQSKTKLILQHKWNKNKTKTNLKEKWRQSKIKKREKYKIK